MGWLDFAWRRLLAGFCLYLIGTLNGALIVLMAQEPKCRTEAVAAMLITSLLFGVGVWQLIKPRYTPHHKTE